MPLYFHTKETVIMSDSVKITVSDNFVLTVPKQFAKYRYLKSIGTGSFSAVVLVQHTQTKEKFACKVVSRALLVSEGIFDRFEQEVRVLQSLKHPNIVQLIDIVFTEPLIFLIMEYCENGELFKHIVQYGALNDDELHRLFRQIATALNFVHVHNIAHRDLKPENILLDGQMNAKLADFGLCHATSPQALLKTPCGSPFYAPPEIINNVKYDGKRADIWSLGVVLFTMATGSLPWTETNQTKLFLQIQEADIHIPPNLSPPIHQMLNMMLCRDASKRPTCEEILKLPWVAGDDENESLNGSGLQSCKSLNPSALKNTDDAWKATHSATFKKPLNVRPDKSMKKNATNTTTQAQVMAPIASLVRKVPPTGRRKP